MEERRRRPHAEERHVAIEAGAAGRTLLVLIRRELRPDVPRFPVRRLAAAAVGADLGRRMDQIVREHAPPWHDAQFCANTCLPRANTCLSVVMCDEPPGAAASDGGVVVAMNWHMFTTAVCARDEVRALLRAVGLVDRRLRAAGAVRQVRHHALGGAHADVEVDAQRRRLAAGIVLAALTRAMHRDRLAVLRQVEVRPLIEIEELRDDARVVDVIALDRRRVDGAGRPGVEDLVARIVRRQVARRRSCRRRDTDCPSSR